LLLFDSSGNRNSLFRSTSTRKVESSKRSILLQPLLKYNMSAPIKTTIVSALRALSRLRTPKDLQEEILEEDNLETQFLKMQALTEKIETEVERQMHWNDKCNKYDNAKARLQIAKEKKLCTRCLRRNHSSAECKTPAKCYHCGRLHPTALCFQRNPNRIIARRQGNVVRTQQQRDRPSATNCQIVQTNAIENKEARALLMTIEAPIYNPQRPHIKQKALIFIDPGSQRSFISAKMADSLDLPVIVANETCRLTSFGERRAKEYKSDLVRANLQTKGGGKLSIVLNKLKFLVNPLPLYDLKELTGEELNQVRLTTNVEHRQPDLLIGMDLFHELKVEKKTTLPSGFTISESRLGKLLSGAGQIENAIGAHTVFAASIQVNAAFECDDNSDDETSESKRKNWPNENSPGNNSAKGKKKRPKNKSSKKKESRDKMVNHNLPSNNWPEERSTKKKSKKTNTPLDKDSEEEKINKTSEKIEVPPSNQNADESKQRDSTRIENPQSNKDVKEDIQKKSKRTDTPLGKNKQAEEKENRKTSTKVEVLPSKKAEEDKSGNSTKVEPPQGNHNAEEERQINSTRVDTPLGNQYANEEEITKKSKRTDTPLVKKAEEKEKPSGKSHKKAQEEDKIKNPVKDTNPLGNQQPKSKTDKSIQLRLKHLRASLTRMPVEIK